MDALSPTESWMRDRRLVEDVRCGDGRAFARIYDRHAAELDAFCRRMLGSRHDAEDALQQTFMKAYRAIRGSDELIALRPWLYSIARNECLSVLRAGRRRPIAEADEASEPCARSAASHVEEREALRATLGDIARLPREQRDALLLSGPGGLNGDEVAGALTTDRERVKALVFRARRSLAASRDARETDCAEIRAQLGALSGGSLRRREIREHLIACEGCRDFREDRRRGVAERPARAAHRPASPRAVSSPVRA